MKRDFYISSTWRRAMCNNLLIEKTVWDGHIWKVNASLLQLSCFVIEFINLLKLLFSMFSIFQKFYAQSFKIVCQNWLYLNMPHSSLPLYFMYFLFIPSWASISLRRNCSSHNSPFFSFLKIFKYLCSLCK